MYGHKLPPPPSFPPQALDPGIFRYMAIICEVMSSPARIPNNVNPAVFFVNMTMHRETREQTRGIHSLLETFRFMCRLLLDPCTLTTRICRDGFLTAVLNGEHWVRLTSPWLSTQSATYPPARIGLGGSLGVCRVTPACAKSVANGCQYSGCSWEATFPKNPPARNGESDTQCSNPGTSYRRREPRCPKMPSSGIPLAKTAKKSALGR